MFLLAFVESIKLRFMFCGFIWLFDYVYLLSRFSKNDYSVYIICPWLLILWLIISIISVTVFWVWMADKDAWLFYFLLGFINWDLSPAWFGRNLLFLYICIYYIDYVDKSICMIQVSIYICIYICCCSMHIRLCIRAAWIPFWQFLCTYTVFVWNFGW